MGKGAANSKRMCIITPPSGRGLVIPVFFVFFFFFRRGHLPQTSARSKQYLPVILVRFIFLAVLLCFTKIFRESCVEKYKKFNGVDFSSMRARKVLASFEAGMNSPKFAVTRKHYVIERQKLIRGIVLLSLKHLSNHGLRVDLYVSFFSR